MLKELMTDTEKRPKRWNERKFRYKFVSRCLLHPVTTIKYLNGLCGLEHPGKLITGNPILPTKIQRPYLYKGLSVRNRAKAILEHYRFVQSFPHYGIKQLFLSEKQTLLAYVEGKGGSKIDIFCGPCGYDREGELTLTLCFNEIPLARLSFAFIRHAGQQAAFIAGLQGPDKSIGVGIIRDATKKCYGLFPKRILYEAFTAVLKECGINEIYAVSERNHVYRQLRYFFQKRTVFVASYSEFWESIDGVKEGTLYHLPLQKIRKSPENIASKKRAEYRNRYRLLDTTIQEINNYMELQRKRNGP